MLPSSRQR